MKKIIFLAFVTLLSVTFVGCGDSSDMEANVFSAYGVSDDVQIIDVRTPEEFKSGCIREAENIDVQSAEFAEKIETLDKDADYLVYCRSGRRSSQAVEIMKSAGFENVTDLNGGVLNWQSQGNELSRNCG